MKTSLTGIAKATIIGVGLGVYGICSLVGGGLIAMRLPSENIPYSIKYSGPKEDFKMAPSHKIDKKINYLRISYTDFGTQIDTHSKQDKYLQGYL